MSVSAKDLAAKLNISAATVSMVLNNKPGISEATRMKVLAAARQYGYVFKPRSSDPSTDYSKVINFVIYKKHGTVVTDTPFFTELMEGIVQACEDAAYLPKISYHYADASFSAQAEKNLYRNSAGLILLGTEMDAEDLLQFLRLDVTTVVLDAYFEEVAADYVLINNVQGAYLATSHLIACGHQSVGYLKSSVHISNFAERANGYYNALRHHGISTSHPYVIELAPQTEQGYADMLRYLEGNPPLATAYFADNDIIAAAAMRGFAKFNYRLPEDISIIGFDDMPFCQLTTPALSTMRVPKRIMGSTAVKRLLEKLQGETELLKISVATELTARASVCKIDRKQEV